MERARRELELEVDEEELVAELVEADEWEGRFRLDLEGNVYVLNVAG
jgi:hypothetical protein